MLRILPGDLDDPRIIALLATHVAGARAGMPRESAHALDVSGLKASDLVLWAAWDGDTLAGVGALRAMGPAEGEIKSMHTAQAARRRGVGSALLRHIIAEATARGYGRLYLETGAIAGFAPARALYRAQSFVECGPFGPYSPDPVSVFMTLPLGPA
ncbi:GNAT family N-acetyltransferase [soil metagenome]